jgi:hypothetical protein
VWGIEDDGVLTALVLMVEQFLRQGDLLDAFSLQAGERALAALSERGLVDLLAGGQLGRWTAAGLSLVLASAAPASLPAASDALDEDQAESG